MSALRYRTSAPDVPTIDVIKNAPLTLQEIDGNFKSLDNTKQDNLVSGTNIKTVNGSSVLGSGNLVVGDVYTVGDQTISGIKTWNDTQSYINATQLLLKSGTASNPTLIHRNDGTNYYILISNASTTPSPAWNSLRPLTINLTTGTITSSNGQTFSGGLTTSSQITSTVAAGTAPFVVASNTIVSNLNADLLDGFHASSFESVSSKGVANGYAGLDASGKVPSAQLPSFVDDVLEFSAMSAFPVTGESGKIYVALDTNKTYRWSGSAYIYITSGAVDSVAGKTGVVTLTKSDVGLGNVDNTSDANKPISTATQTALNGKANLANPVFTGAVTISESGTAVPLTITNTGTGNSLVIEDQSADSSPFTIAPDGTVLIGTKTKLTDYLGYEFPATLQITSNNSLAPNANVLFRRNTNDTVGAILSFQKAKGTNENPVSVVSDDECGRIGFSGYTGTTHFSIGNISAQIDGTPSATSSPGRIVIRTVPENSTIPVERLRISQDGKSTFTGYVDINNSSNNTALTITNTGTGNSLVINDENPDTSPVIVTSDGKLVVGASAGVAGNSGQIEKLQVSGTGAQDSALGLYAESLSTSGNLRQYRKRPSNASVIDGDALGGNAWFGWDGSSYRQSVFIGSGVQGTVTTNSVPSKFFIRTTSVGGTSPADRMVFNNDGTVVVNSGLIGPNDTQQHALPAVASDTFALLNATQTLTNKTLGSGTSFSAAPSSGYPIYSNGKLEQYSGGDISTLVTGSGSGIVLRSAENSHVVVALDANDDSDSFSVVSHASTTGTTVGKPMDKLSFRVTRQGVGTFGSGVAATTYTSTALTGTAPLTVASTTLVTNLNADLLDGKHVGNSGNTVPLLDGTNTWSGAQTFANNVTFGDASTDSLTINSSVVSIPNSLNFDNGTFYINSIANEVGIGTSTTDAKLTVDGSSYDVISIKRAGGSDLNTGIRYQQASSYWMNGVGSDGSFAISYNIADISSSTQFRLLQNGNVGIGTRTPTSKLEVIGDTKTNILTIADSNDTIESTTGMSSWYYTSHYSVASQDTEPRAVFFSSDGTKMYVLGNAGDDVNQYSLSTAWSVSTATYVKVFTVSSQAGTSVTDLYFSPDGTKMYVASDSNDSIYRYNLSTAWDVGTCVYVNSFSVTSQETVPLSLYFSTDGTKMYVAGSTGDDVNQYNLSTAWDITTATYSTVFSLSNVLTDPQGISFSDDGLRMYVIGTPARGAQYNLSTAWSISTATFNGVVNLGLLGNYNTAFPSGLYVNETRGIAYISDYNTDIIFQLSTNVPATKFTGSKWIFETDLHAEYDVVANQRIRANNDIISATNLISYGNASVSGTLDVRGALDLADDDVFRIGSSDDLEFYHSSSLNTNIIDITTGDLIIRDDATSGDPTRFSFERSTGNFLATGRIGLGSQYVDENSAGVSATITAGVEYEIARAVYTVNSLNETVIGELVLTTGSSSVTKNFILNVRTETLPAKSFTFTVETVKFTAVDCELKAYHDPASGNVVITFVSNTTVQNYVVKLSHRKRTTAWTNWTPVTALTTFTVGTYTNIPQTVPEYTAPGKLRIPRNAIVYGDAVEGGEISLFDKDNTTAKAFLDVDGSGHVRLFTISNDTNTSIGQFSGTGGATRLFAGGLQLLSCESDSTVQIRNSSGFGYGTNTGQSVTQLTNKSTAVTINKPNGRITTHNAALAAGAAVAFTVNNTSVSVNDHILVTPYASVDWSRYDIKVSISTTNGAFIVILKNISAGSLSESVAFNFMVMKGSAA